LEGIAVQPRYGADNGCADVQKVHTKPFIYYSRSKGFAIPGAQEHCMRGTVSPAAFTFMPTTDWGSKWQNRLIWADSSMQCIFVLANDDKGLPSPDTKQMSLISYNSPTGTDGKWVSFQIIGGGQDAALYAVDYDQSQIVKFTYTGDRSIDGSVPVAKSGKSSKSTKSSAALSTLSTVFAAIFAIVFAVVW
jgi:hypothetical protein